MLGIKILANEIVVVSHPLKSIEEVLARAGESSKGRRKPLNAFILRPRLCLECGPSPFGTNCDVVSEPLYWEHVSQATQMMEEVIAFSVSRARSFRSEPSQPH